MPIEAADIKWYKSALTSDSTPAQNGGRLSAVEIISGVRGNIFPDVPQAERIAGSTKWRKVFIKVETDPSIDCLNTLVFINAPAPGDDYVLLQYTGSQTDTEDTIPGGTRHFGLGTLKTGISIGATEIIVVLEHPDMENAALQPFQPGDTLWISGKATMASPGDEEYLTIGPDPGDVAYDNGECTITLASGVTFNWDEGVKIASCIDVGTLVANYSDLTVTSASGTYDDTDNLVTNGIGTLEQDWTITITDGVTGAFRLDGDTLGSSVDTGSTGSDFQPENPDFPGTPYFTLKSVGWGGTWATNDTLTFTTSPAAVPIWQKRIVPAGAASLSNDGNRTAFVGESA